MRPASVQGVVGGKLAVLISVTVEEAGAGAAAADWGGALGMGGMRGEEEEEKRRHKRRRASCTAAEEFR